MKKYVKLFGSYDIICAVPIHKKRKAERGYNQSELIAKEISKKLQNIEYKDILIKTKNNKRQSDLKREDRIDNVRNVYEIRNKQIIKDKKIIIFDDVYTTGNTVNECSRVLKENGANKILVLTLASGN